MSDGNNQFEIIENKIDWLQSPFHGQYNIGDIVVLTRLINPMFPSAVQENAIGVIKNIQENENQEFANETCNVYFCETLSNEHLATDCVLGIDQFIEMYNNKIIGYRIGIEKMKDYKEKLSNGRLV